MKPLEAAKSRLAPKLAAGERRALALNLLLRVVRCASRASLNSVWVVGGGAVVRELAEEAVALWLEDQMPDLNSCLAHCFKVAFQLQLAALYLSGDLPLVDWPEIHDLAGSLRPNTDLVICPDERGEGTNALLVPVGSPIQPSLGPGSFQRHLQAACSLGLKVTLYQSPGLAFDLDTPLDLVALEERSPGTLANLIQ